MTMHIKRGEGDDDDDQHGLISKSRYSIASFGNVLYGFFSA